MHPNIGQTAARPAGLAALAIILLQRMEQFKRILYHCIKGHKKTEKM